MTVTALEPVVHVIDIQESELRFYRREGYLPLPGFLRAELVSEVRDEVFDALGADGISRSDLRHASSSADKLRQCSRYLAGSRLDSLINGEATLALAATLIGGRAVRYLPFTAVKAGGGKRLDYHQDNSYTQHEPAVGSMNIWVALDDMAPENGCLQIMPRSNDHQWAARNSDDGDSHRQVDVDPVECVPIRMRAGDAVAFTRWTVHGSGPNTTSEPRVAYALQYHREDVKWLDRETGEWRLLIDNPRSATPPLPRLG